MDKSFLITGGAGYIGTALTKRLIDEGAQVTVFDNLETGQSKLVDARARFFKGDVRNLADLECICKGNKFETVIHLAAHQPAPTVAPKRIGVEGQRQTTDAAPQPVPALGSTDTHHPVDATPQAEPALKQQ